MSTDLDWFDRLALAIAGLLGAAGVASAAAATHTGDQHLLGSLALVALTQAPALVALALHGSRQFLMRAATAFIMAGAALFALDIAAIHFLGASPVPFAAPAGGLAMIAGWLALAAAAIVRR